MFDPRSYRDTDFGLQFGESFEPEDADGSPSVDLSRPHVMTVLGPIDPEDLGICLTHVHLFSNPETESTVEPGYPLDHRARAAEVLESFAFAGGRSVVDAATADAGRDAAGLYGLAQHIPLHIIATTGRQNRIPVSAPPDADAMAREFVKELTSGVEDTPALAGIIRVGTTAARINDSESACLRAAAKAHLATGAPVAVPAGNATHAHDLLDVLQHEGVAADRVILQHLDHDSPIDMVMRLAGRGAWCSFDRMGEANSDADVARAHRLINLFDTGFGARVLISQDQERRSVPGTASGSARLTYLLEWFTLTLMEAGANAEMVRSMLIDNPSHALAIVPPEVERAQDTGR